MGCPEARGVCRLVPCPILDMVGQNGFQQGRVLRSCRASSAAEEARKGIVAGSEERHVGQVVEVGAEVGELLHLVEET